MVYKDFEAMPVQSSWSTWPKVRAAGLPAKVALEAGGGTGRSPALLHPTGLQGKGVLREEVEGGGGGRGGGHEMGLVCAGLEDDW